jgi:fructose-1,6-bisphosphatase
MDKGTWEDYLEDLLKERKELMTERDLYKSIAEEAVSNLEQAMKLLEAIQDAVHD